MIERAVYAVGLVILAPIWIPSALAWEIRHRHDSHSLWHAISKR